MNKEKMMAMAKLDMMKGLVEKFEEVGGSLADLETGVCEGICGKELLEKLKIAFEGCKWMLNHTEANTTVTSKITGESETFHVTTIDDTNIQKLMGAIDAFKVCLAVATTDEDLMEKTLDKFFGIFADLLDGIAEELMSESKKAFKIAGGQK